MSAESTYPHGEVFLDARGQGRALRLTWHHEADVVVLSLWRDRTCAGTFRLSTADVDGFVDALVDGLRDGSADGETHAREAPVVPHTGAIDVSAPRPAVAATPAVGPVEVPAEDRAEDTDGDADDDTDHGPAESFVDWVMRGDEGRASA